MVTETLHTLVCEFENAAFEHTQALRTEREPRMSNATSALHLAREDLMAHLAGLERDAARLDWLERQVDPLHLEQDWKGGEYTMQKSATLYLFASEYRAPTIRKAIDAARAATTTEE